MTTTEQFADALCEPELTVTVAVFVPAVEYDLVIEEPDPDKPSVPDHEYVYAPVPPEAEAINVVELSVCIEEGFEKQEAVRFAVGAVTTTLQLAVLLCEPELTVTVAVFVPAVEYDLVIEEPDPDKPSVPVHEYVYAPVPPDAEEVNTVEFPTFTAEGLAKQETFRSCASEA